MKMLLKQKLKKEHHLKGTLRKQSNKHQNSHKTLLKSDKKNTSCMPKTAISPNFKTHQLGLAGSKWQILPWLNFRKKKLHQEND